MIVYHFCADFSLSGILRDGLTLGKIAWMTSQGAAFVEGFQWVTTEPARDKQEWCNPETSSLPYDRCANRLTIKIPKTSRKHIHRWVDIGRLIVPKQQFELLNAFGEPELYLLFCGRIPPSWIRRVERLGEREPWKSQREARGVEKETVGFVFQSYDSGR